ncbi:MAG: hypothetical protein GWN00_05790 [Aliifodinibius sp.]|nr:hypothetical protein [Fodinibius sp.]NIY24336.1 hypothetical protein [Fodinibius sp.]
MSQSTKKIGFVGIAVGSMALLLALVHFWAGPFSPQPTLETTVAEKAASIKSATIKALKGEEYKKTYKASWNADKVTNVATAIFGGIAFILSILAFAKKEPTRVAAGGAVLGVSAIAFQFIAMYAMALLVVLLIAAVLSSLGIG